MALKSLNINTVGIVGAGVIGASWTARYLANGLKVIVSDPAPGAEKELKSHLSEMWPSVEKLGLSEGASLENYRFVGKSITAHGQELDYVQEVCHIRITRRMSSSYHRMVQRIPKAKSRS